MVTLPSSFSPSQNGRSPGTHRPGLLSNLGDTHATGNEKSAENCCPDLLNDECRHFRRGNNYGVECTRTQRQRLLLDSRRGGSEPYSGRAFRVADRTASASTLQSVVLKHLAGSKIAPPCLRQKLRSAQRLTGRLSRLPPSSCQRAKVATPGHSPASPLWPRCRSRIG